MKKQFVRAEIDDYPEIARAARSDTFGFVGLKEAQDFEAVQQFRNRVEKVFQLLDKKMTTLCGDGELILIEWATRMQLVRTNLDRLDRSLAFKSKRQFNWDEVLQAMGLLNALRVATEQTVSLNEEIR